mmetsp:Transcript_13491/g.31737  ORF Transcript_13491/g.31737 Transcript_13491/m.31737 type:complete len:227 (-) Transcript_13491:239-919(-)
MSSEPLLPPVGLVQLSEEDRAKNQKQGTILVVVATAVFTALGFGIAALVYYFGARSKYDDNMKFIVAHEYYWAYLSAWMVQRLVHWINIYPAIAKGKILPGGGAAGQLRPNPFLYTQLTEEHKPTGPIIGFYGEGDIGVYNRANRSLQHMLENAPGWMVNLIAASVVFPFPCFILMCFIFVGRILHQVGYTYNYGAHAPGFMMSNIAAEVLGGLSLMAFFKGIQLL